MRLLALTLASADLVAVVDSSASETKKLTIGDLVANGVTLISDDTIPGAKILFAAGDALLLQTLLTLQSPQPKLKTMRLRLPSLRTNQRLIWSQRCLHLERLRVSLL